MIHALTNDPALALPLLKMVPGGKLIVHIQLSGPGATNAQVFYNTTDARDFNEAHSVRTPIHKGDMRVTEIIGQMAVTIPRTFSARQLITSQRS
jgi:hypothetical protein